ncbi:hypothetical protein ACWEQL_00875 [Kitasatospora sp. NPDC004240]
MSDYHDLFLTVDLPADLPEPALRELRWLLGEGEMSQAPASADWEPWGEPWPILAGGAASLAFPGVNQSQLVRAVDRPGRVGQEPWALTVRACVHEEEFGVVMEVVGWILRQATTRGWVGFLRYSASEGVQHIVRRADGFDVFDVRTAWKQFGETWA